jgi:hypothetical protein
MARPKSSSVTDPPDAPLDADAGGVAVADAPAEALATAEAPPEAVDAVAVEYHGGDGADAKAIAEQLARGRCVVIPATLTDDERHFLSRRNAILEAAAAEAAATQELAEATLELEDVKKRVKGFETALEMARRRVLEAIRNDPAADAPLFHQPKEQPAAAAAPDAADPEAVKEWEAQWNNWLDMTPVSALGLSDSITEALASHSSPVRNLRELTALTSDQYHPEGYQQVKGIGQGKSDQIQEAYDRLMTAFLQQHPRPKPGQPTETPAAAPEATQVDPPPSDYDFETTFPAPVNATDNETFDADYHKAAIGDAIAECEELQQIKSDLASGTSNGKELTDAKRRKLETALGETQLQYDEGLSLYGTHFGAKAAERLKIYVENKLVKKASLKGGLD